MRSTNRVRLCTAVLCLVIPAAAQSGPSIKPGTGTVQVLPTKCTDVGPLPSTTCTELRVSTQGNPTIDATIRVSEPAPGTTYRGTVVFGSGAQGLGFYAAQGGGDSLERMLQNRGFRIVDRKWKGGWYQYGVGVRKQSARYAVLLQWIYDNVHTGGVFAATGNSAGGAEIGFALTTWGADAILDVAVLSGGPPMSRLDLGCVGKSEWSKTCQNVIPPGVMECAPACLANCARLVANTTMTEYVSNSIVHDAPDLDYPSTRVHVVLGTQDCTTSVPQGFMYYSAITSEKVVEFVPGTPHWVSGTDAGRDAIERAVLGGGICKFGPATLQGDGWPELGGTLNLTITGEPGEGFFVLTSFGTASAPVVWGWSFLAPPLYPIKLGILHSVSGTATFGIPIPNFKPLEGLTLFKQAFAGKCLTNLVRVKFLAASP